MAAIGRNDLSAAASSVVEEYAHRKRVEAVKSYAKEFDQRHLAGFAVQTNRWIRRLLR